MEVFQRHHGEQDAQSLVLANKQISVSRETKLHLGDLGGRVTDRPYAEVVGSLMYLMTCTQPDLAQSVGALSRFVSDVRTEHWEAAVKVLR
jgi:hypothetical protein